MKPLSAALEDWIEVQSSVGETVITVNDLTCYEKEWGLLVKVNGQEPEGINNGYKSPREIERDLASVVPGYVKGAAVWQEKPEEEYDD